MLSNRVTLSGHLGADPKALASTNGEIFTSARLAISNRYTDRSGNTVDDTQWFNVVAFGRRAERMLAQLHKGDRLTIEGRLTMRSYETSTGERRQSIQIVVSSFEQLPKLSARKAALTELLAEAKATAAHDSVIDSIEIKPQAFPTKRGTSVAKTSSSTKRSKAASKAVQA